jgi:hypothetical protein
MEAASPGQGFGDLPTQPPVNPPPVRKPDNLERPTSERTVVGVQQRTSPGGDPETREDLDAVQPATQSSRPSAVSQSSGNVTLGVRAPERQSRANRPLGPAERSTPSQVSQPYDDAAFPAEKLRPRLHPLVPIAFFLGGFAAGALAMFVRWRWFV